MRPGSSCDPGRSDLLPAPATGRQARCCGRPERSASRGLLVLQDSTPFSRVSFLACGRAKRLSWQPAAALATATLRQKAFSRAVSPLHEKRAPYRTPCAAPCAWKVPRLKPCRSVCRTPCCARSPLFEASWKVLPVLRTAHETATRARVEGPARRHDAAAWHARAPHGAWSSAGASA